MVQNRRRIARLLFVISGALFAATIAVAGIEGSDSLVPDLLLSSSIVLLGWAAYEFVQSDAGNLSRFRRRARVSITVGIVAAIITPGNIASHQGFTALALDSTVAALVFGLGGIWLYRQSGKGTP